MNNNNAGTSRMKITVGAIIFEIEGSEALVKEGMNYAKQHLLTKEVREVAKQFPTEVEKPVEKEKPASVEVGSFYKEKNPRSDMERVTVLAYYAKESRDITEISEPELSTLFNEAGAKLPKNVMQAIRNAARKQYGYLEATGRGGYYRITNAGINRVKLQLPRLKKENAK